MTLALLILTFGPSLIWLYWLWSRDKFRREPISLVALLMLAGGVISVGTVLVAVPLYLPHLPAWAALPGLREFFEAGLPEEIAKLLPVMLFAWRRKVWDEPFDGIVYAGATALGFHLVETAEYMLASQDAWGSVYQGLVRGSKPGHMLYGIAMGYFLSKARFAPLRQKPKYFALAVLVPVLLHTAWDTFASFGGSFVGGQRPLDLIYALVAWGLSVGLWVTAFNLMQQDEEISPFNPEGPVLPMAEAPCGQCGSGYPEGAAYCHVCGTPVGQG